MLIVLEIDLGKGGLLLSVVTNLIFTVVGYFVSQIKSS